MKKYLFLLLLSCAPLIRGFAQGTLTFWTNNKNYGPIKVYYNDSYAGTITRAYSSSPGCGAEGCVTVTVSGSGNTWSAEAEDGSRWTSSPATLTNPCTMLRLYGTPNSSSSGDSGTVPVFDSSDADFAAAVAVVAAAAAVAVGVVYTSTDIYARGATSSEYSGFSVGLRNSMDSHIDIEAGIGSYYRLNNPVLPKGMATDWNFDRRGSEYADRDKATSTFEANFLYNIRARDVEVRRIGEYYSKKYYLPDWNVLLGVGTSTILNRRISSTPKGTFAIGPVAGFSMGFGRTLKLELRYKALWNPAYEREMFNQIELGIAVRYKEKFRFKDK